MEDTIPTVPSQTSPTSRIALATLIILLLSSLSLSAFLGYQNLQLQKQIVQLSIQPTPSPSSQTVTDPTSNWKLYTDSTLGITFKVPNDFDLSIDSEGETQSETGTKYCITYTKKTFSFIYPVKAGAGPCNGSALHIASTSKDFSAGREGGFGDYQGYKNINGKYSALFVGDRNIGLEGNFFSEVTNNNGMTFLRIDGKNEWQDYGGDRLFIPIMGTPGDGFMGALINIDNQNYYGFNVQMKVDSETDKKIFDQILSTFKFIEPKQP